MIPFAPLGTDAAAGHPQGLGAAGAGPDQAAAERRFRFELAAHPGSPAQARRLARARLTGWSVCEDTCDTAALVISELVTNAIVHTASGTVVCELHDGDDLVRIAVRDEGCAPGEPHPSPQRPEEEHGRGLFLVDALCHAWGAQEDGPGLLVWADLPRGGEGSHDHAGQRDDVTEPVSCDDLPAPRGDLGWGARPKPGPADGSGGEDDTAGHGEQGHRGLDAEDRTSGPGFGRAHRAFLADGPLARVARQRQHGPAAGGPTAGSVRPADHALDTHGEAPSWRPHPGTERDRDRDPA